MVILYWRSKITTAQYNVMHTAAYHGQQNNNKHFLQRVHDASRSAYYEIIADNDKEFAASDAFKKIKRVVKEQEDIYVPTYTDVLRVS